MLNLTTSQCKHDKEHQRKAQLTCDQQDSHPPSPDSSPYTRPTSPTRPHRAGHGPPAPPCLADSPSERKTRTRCAPCIPHHTQPPESPAQGDIRASQRGRALHCATTTCAPAAQGRTTHAPPRGG